MAIDGFSLISDSKIATKIKIDHLLDDEPRVDRTAELQSPGSDDDSSSTVSDGDNNGNVLGLDPNLRRGSDCKALVPFKKRKIGDMDSDWKRFECVTCNRSFSSFQALGGHRSSHSKVKVVGKSRGEGEEGGHRCKICGKSFPSGQALGGHQKRHWWVRPSSSSSSSVSAPQIARSGCLFDLNELPSFENEQDAISFLS